MAYGCKELKHMERFFARRELTAERVKAADSRTRPHGLHID